MSDRLTDKVFYLMHDLMLGVSSPIISAVYLKWQLRKSHLPNSVTDGRKDNNRKNNRLSMGVEKKYFVLF